jgi:hypothetical protein
VLSPTWLVEGFANGGKRVVGWLVGKTVDTFVSCSDPGHPTLQYLRCDMGRVADEFL